MAHKKNNRGPQNNKRGPSITDQLSRASLSSLLPRKIVFFNSPFSLSILISKKFFYHFQKQDSTTKDFTSTVFTTAMTSSVHILHQDSRIIIKLLSALKTIVVPVIGPPSTDRFTLKAMAAHGFSRVDLLEFQDRILSLVFSSPNIPVAINPHSNRTLESKEIPLQNGDDIIERLLLLLKGENHIFPLSFLFEEDEKKGSEEGVSVDNNHVVVKFPCKSMKRRMAEEEYPFLISIEASYLTETIENLTDFSPIHRNDGGTLRIIARCIDGRNSIKMIIHHQANRYNHDMNEDGDRIIFEGTFGRNDAWTAVFNLFRVYQFAANAVRGGVRFGFDNRVKFQWLSNEQFRLLIYADDAVGDIKQLFFLFDS